MCREYMGMLLHACTLTALKCALPAVKLHSFCGNKVPAAAAAAGICAILWLCCLPTIFCGAANCVIRPQLLVRPLACSSQRNKQMRDTAPIHSQPLACTFLTAATVTAQGSGFSSRQHAAVANAKQSCPDVLPP
jgi:hypothetical protein